LRRYAAGMDQQTPPPAEDEEDERDRRAANIFLAVFFVLIVGGGIWLVNAMVAQRDIDNCVAQGRRNCAPIETPAR
jgi:hypothetical protein